MAKLSVLVSSFNQDILTIAHLRECMNSTRLPDEIIVVNDCGDPSLKEMIAELPRRCPIIYARITTDILWNQNGARNLGLFLSKGDYIAVEDNDHIPTRTFYEEAEKLMEQGYDRVCVKQRLVISKDDLNKPMEEWKVLKTRGTARMIAILRREMLVDVKGYDEQFCGRYGWDVPDFMRRTGKWGAKEIGVGQYYVVGDWWCNEKNRTFNNKGVTKMDAVNYHHMVRNSRQDRMMSQIGILNFDYVVERFV